MNLESDWTVYRTRFVVRARKLTDPLIFTDALGRTHSGRPGDYLVEIFDGLLSIAPRKFFEDIYVPLESAAGDSAPRTAPKNHNVFSHQEQVPERAARPVEHLPPALVNARASPLNRAPSVMAPSFSG